MSFASIAVHDDHACWSYFHLSVQITSKAVPEQLCHHKIASNAVLSEGEMLVRTRREGHHGRTAPISDDSFHLKHSSVQTPFHIPF